MSTPHCSPRTQGSGLLLFFVLLGSLLHSGCAGVTGAITPRGNGASVAPSITSQPASADVAMGQTATFTVAVTGTTPLSYQWRKNGSAISGATSSTYTTPPTTASDNRAMFAVVISNNEGSTTSNAATLNVAPTGAVAIVVSPTSSTVTAGATQQFTATVTGNSNRAVTWSLKGSGCSGAACGTISAGGLYTAPSSVPSPATLQVTVTSVADPTKSASAGVSVVVATAILMSISPTGASVPTGGTDSFTAAVTGTSNTTVAWSLTGAGCSGSACGTLATSSLRAVYTAPVIAPSPPSVSIVATSMADPSKTASANVTIVPVVVVTVTPASTSVATGATQQLSASVVGTSNTAVTWTVQGAGCSSAACGTVNGAGVYTAPSTVPSPSTVSVTATSTADPSKTGSASIVIFSATATKTTTAYGLTFPNAHPRLFWTPSRTTIAQNWVKSTNYPGVTVDFRPLDYYDLAFTCFIMNNATACSTVIADAVAVSPQCSSGAGCDTMRGTGEWVMLVRDWLAPGCGRAQCLTTTQASTIDANWSILQANQDNPIQTWGNVGMPTSNYFAGQFRNDFDFGIASYIDNVNADASLKYGIQNRWNDLLNYVSQTGTGKNGAKGYAMHNQEGVGEYGRYSLNYYAIPLASSALLGRDLWNETTAFKSGVLTTIYNTMLTQTTSRGMWDGFTSADDETWVAGSGCGYISHNGPDGHGGCGMSSQNYGDFMQAAATEYNATNIGKYARQWISTVNPAIGPIFKSVDPGGTALPFSNLPLDYYSSGAQYMYLHGTWASTGTAMLWQLGLNQGGNQSPTSAVGTGHYHLDSGTFQVSRKGVNIIRETMGYGEFVAGYNGAGTVPTQLGYAHNVPLIGGQGIGTAPNAACSDGPGVVSRLETQPSYAFAATDLTQTYKNAICDSGNPGRQNQNVVSVVREFYYFRGINVLAIVDRLQTDTPTRSTTFVSHCETSPTVVSATIKCVDGTQEALYTALIPAAPAIAVITENANSANAPNWQYRIEANNANPGNVVSYNIYTIQLGDASGFSALTPGIVDSAPGTPTTGTFTITLDANDSLVINKGIASTGGTIKAAGSTKALAAGVQGMTVTDSGPVWQ